jgi:hypothetical protein
MLILGEIVGSYDLSVILQNKELIQASDWYLPALILILLGASPNRRSSRSTSGCRTRWPRQPRCRPICIRPPW